MFTGFFYALREAGVPVSLREWLTFLEALAEGVVAPSLASFHAVARAVLVKDEAHYDRFDAVFTAYFADVATPEQLVEAALRWVQDALRERRLSEAERQALLAGIEPADLERLARLFAERLREQDGQHHGGSYWIGTGGTSPFGRGGVHPNGLRVG
ncbi:MAG: VWA containing CoxE family protein, partial [Clostridia bacterium]|nr:VWA containing CoxE family protein [Clostridia bacterium]